MLGVPSGKSAFKFATAGYVVLMIGWFAVVFRSYGVWHEGHSFIWNFQVSLFDFAVSRNWSSTKAQQHHRISRLSQQFDSMKSMEPISLDIVRFQFCKNLSERQALLDPWCDFTRRLQIASWTMLSFCTIGFVCLAMGIMAGFNFHYIKPRDDHPWWATGYLLMAPILFSIGVLQYYVQTNDFGALVDESVEADGFSSFGRSFGVAMILSVATWIPTWIMIAFSFRSLVFKDTDEESLLGVDIALEVDYGAVMSMLSSPSLPLFSGPSPDDAAVVDDPQSQPGVASLIAKFEKQAPPTVQSQPYDSAGSASELPHEAPAPTGDLQPAQKSQQSDSASSTSEPHEGPDPASDIPESY